MPDADAGPGYYAYLTYNVPLSTMRAHRLVAALAAADPRTVLDAGCGWGELLLQVLACVPAASGVGVDTDPRALARGRANADSLGLTDRVRFVEAAAAEATQEPADVVICLGSSQAFGSSADALHALYPLLRPGGRLLFGDAIWERPPTAELIEQLAGLGTVTDLAGVVDIAIDAGFRPLSIGSASRAEWEEFESGYLADWEEWLLGNTKHPDAGHIRAAADAHRDQWLRGYRARLAGDPGPSRPLHRQPRPVRLCRRSAVLRPHGGRRGP